MPYDVIERKTVRQLQLGMRLTDYGEQVVRAIRPKVKYAMIDIAPTRDSDDVTTDLRWNLDDTVRVTVQKLTEPEIFERDYQRSQDWALKELGNGLATVPADYLTDLAQKWREGSYRGHVMDWSEGATFFHLQAMYKAWRTVQYTLDRLRELYGSDVTPLSALVLELDRRDEDRRTRGPVDPLSRSTSMLSSMLDDLDRWSWEKLADSTRYYMSMDIREHEMARIKQLADARKAAKSGDAR